MYTKYMYINIDNRYIMYTHTSISHIRTHITHNIPIMYTDKRTSYIRTYIIYTNTYIHVYIVHTYIHHIYK